MRRRLSWKFGFACFESLWSGQIWNAEGITVNYVCTAQSCGILKCFLTFLLPCSSMNIAAFVGSTFKWHVQMVSICLQTRSKSPCVRINGTTMWLSDRCSLGFDEKIIFYADL